jgi:hypothetical protein
MPPYLHGPGAKAPVTTHILHRDAAADDGNAAAAVLACKDKCKKCNAGVAPVMLTKVPQLYSEPAWSRTQTDQNAKRLAKLYGAASVLHASLS